MLGSDIRLVRPTLSHAAAMLAIENSPLVWRYSKQGDAPYTIEEIEAFINASGTLLSDGQVRFLVELRRGDGAGEVIGIVDLYDYDADSGDAWVGIVIYPFSLHGKGYGTAALHLLAQQAAQLGVKRLCAQVDPNNSASLALFTSARVGRFDGSSHARHLLLSLRTYVL